MILKVYFGDFNAIQNTIIVSTDHSGRNNDDANLSLFGQVV